MFDQLPLVIIALLISLSVHEWAHAYSAYLLGDDTAAMQGRLTLNPLAHLDPVGTVFMILSSMSGIFIGWAKPVPVNPYNLGQPKRDMALVALAGPFSNLVLAIFTVIITKLLTGMGGGLLLGSFLQIFFIVNISLMAFNLLPVAPLDGSKIIGLIVPDSMYQQYNQYLQYGPYILIAILIGEFSLNIPILSWWMNSIISPILALLT
jgi:Zn-dependent protease